MNKPTIALATGLALTLAACGSADDASTEAEADTVEVPANDALEGVVEEPVVDPEATAVEDATAEAEAAAAAQAADAEAAGNAAADVAAQVEAAAAAEDETE